MDCDAKHYHNPAGVEIWSFESQAIMSSWAQCANGPGPASWRWPVVGNLHTQNLHTQSVYLGS